MDTIDPRQQADYQDWLDTYPAETAPYNAATRWVYDQNGRQLSRTLPNDADESYTYDTRGRVLTHTDFKGQMTWYIYDNTPAHGGRVVAEYRFAPANVPGSLQNPESTSYDEKSVYVYDDDASLPTGEQLKLGRRVEVREYARISGTVTLVRTEHTTFDPTGGQVTSAASTEGTIYYAYDTTTGLLTDTWTGNAAKTLATTHTIYGYDLFGRLASVTSARLLGQDQADPAGVYRFDADGDPVAAEGPTTFYAYDVVGNLDTVTLPNGVMEDYDYDSLNRLTHLLVHQGTRNIFEQTYTLATDGQREAVLEKRWNADGSAFSGTRIEWEYDAMGRLVSEDRDQDDDDAKDTNDYTDVFAYDLASNRVTKQHGWDADRDLNTTGVLEAGEVDETVAYTYNERDQLTAEDSTINANDAEYEYNANGSTTLKSTSAGDSTYTWDLRNRMVAVDAPGTANDATYSYDSDGVRVQEAASSGTTYYLNDPQNPTGYAKAIEEKSSPTITTRSYVLGLKVEGQADATNGTLYLLADGHGSTRALLNTAGAVTDSYDYRAFGEALGFDAATAKTPWLFGGDGVYDPASGWTYHLARWRNGFWFTSMDSYAGNTQDPLSLHKYLYANANSISYDDASGHAAGLICTAISVAEGAATELMKFGAFAMAIGAAGFVFSWAVAYSTSVAMQLVGPQSEWWSFYYDRHMAARELLSIAVYRL